MELAPIYIARESEDRHLQLTMPSGLYTGLLARGLLDEYGHVTTLGRTRLNAFTDAIGLSLAARRAVVRRLARRREATP